MMIIFFAVVTIILLGVGMFKYNLKEQELESLRSLSTKLLDTNHQMYKTLAMGLYYRFYLFIIGRFIYKNKHMNLAILTMIQMTLIVI
ncbi:hypothetical protein LOZ80_19935 [Paenibacillus sp. HWE-109]|uniref:hypothetical protein n=1 Tax=Paenibacillus sp. HWE-109 TaxID=1306526 RepID=UPI001EDDF91F|nr:hypothetical protein [Paenibacillus sp. HWE-109]UKS23915.1 hypothetical protein LOZ80_19935 [Paenibacillus sp. HWE-109]